MNVLITGIQSYLAQLVAGTLAAQPGVTVTGAAPSLAGVAEHGVAEQGVTLVEATLRGQALNELFERVQPDTLIHLEQLGGQRRAGQLQTMELLATAVRHGIGNIILRSSTLVYGASAEHPAFTPEDFPIDGSAAGLRGDYRAVERFAAELASKNPAIRIVRLRYAGLLGPGEPSPLARYLAGRPAPTLLGFNPRIQGLHVHDAALACALAAFGTAAGAFNIAAEPLGLLHAIQLAGGMPLPLPSVAFAPWPIARSIQRNSVEQIPFDSSVLRFGCVADTSRTARELGWQARYTTASALAAPHGD